MGFPAEAFQSKATYSVEELDTMTSLFVTAYYPNVCLYKDKRLIRTSENKVGIISKGTVLYAYVQDGVVKSSTTLPSPLFIYTEKSAMQGLITSKQMTMISHMHYLLHGIRHFKFIPTTAGKLFCYASFLFIFKTIRFINDFTQNNANLCLKIDFFYLTNTSILLF